MSHQVPMLRHDSRQDMQAPEPQARMAVSSAPPRRLSTRPCDTFVHASLAAGQLPPNSVHGTRRETHLQRDLHVPRVGIVKSQHTIVSSITGNPNQGLPREEACSIHVA